MKKIILAFFVFAFVANVSAQLKVNSSGNTYVANLESSSGFLGTTGNVPFTFKVNNVLSGFSGGTGNTNVSFGYQALSSLYGGYDNVAVGVGAMRNPSGSGWENTATGYYALYNNFEGWSNTAIGRCALYNNTDGSYNTATGGSALRSNTTGWGNTASGYFALSGNTTGFNNTAIGYNAGVNNSNLYNATAIGYNAVVDSSNHVRIGNTLVTKVGSYGTWTTFPSDGRAKKNIRANVPGLAFVNLLQPVTYNINLDVVDELERSDDPGINAFRDSLRMARSSEQKEIEAIARANKEKIVYTGFIAQDVEKAARSVGYDFSGVDAVSDNGKGVYGIRYAEFVVPLVKAVQELSEQNDAKDAAVTSLQEQVNELKAEITELKLAPQLRSAEVVIDEGGAVVIEQQAKLYQNTPNPFNQSTQIQFYVPETVNKALLCIYDLQGKQLKQTVITQRGYGIETIFASEFRAGIYLYALLADGNQVDVKRMILTE